MRPEVDAPEPIHMILRRRRRAGSPARCSSRACSSAGPATSRDSRASADNSAELANGWILKADNIHDLAVKMGRDPDELQSAVDKWNADCDAGKDTQFDIGDPARPYMRPANRLQKFTTGPFYAIQAHQCTLNTQGGMKRNPLSQVMSIEGPPIPRLYAAGENGDIWTILYQCMSTRAPVAWSMAGSPVSRLPR